MIFVKASLAAFLLSFCHRADADSSTNQRELRPFFYTYEPRSDVVDHAFIDLDQKEIMELLSVGNNDAFMSAANVYVNGAHSRPYAVVKLDSPVSYDIMYDRTITGVNENGHTVTGKVLNDVEMGGTELQFLYDTATSLSEGIGCQPGGSPPVLRGCLSPSGTLRLGSIGTPIPYTYNPLTDNFNGRRFDKFSTEAEDKMHKCGDTCPYEDYQKFFRYYGAHDYAHQWVQSAFQGLETNFKNGVADFSLLSRAGRAGAISTATVVLSLWMYIIRELEVAVNSCVDECSADDCTTNSVHAWDQAVAFYTGSMEERGTGNLLYNLANEMCKRFGTCDSEDTITAKVNNEIFEHFNFGQQMLLDGRCSEAKDHKRRIVKLMTIPLVQATLHHAYSLDFLNDTRESTKGTAATFAAAVLPIVSDCNDWDAENMYITLLIGRDVAYDFASVKELFEKNYECMGITCEDIGGLMAPEVGTYLEGATPCGVLAQQTNYENNNNNNNGRRSSPGFVVGMTVVGICGLGVLVQFYRMKYGSKIEFQGSVQDLEGKGIDNDVVFVDDDSNRSDAVYVDNPNPTNGDSVYADGTFVVDDVVTNTNQDDAGFRSVRIEL